MNRTTNLPANARQIGTGISKAELRLEHHLIEVSQWRGKELWYTPVTGGLQNSNWRIDVLEEKKPYFFKVPGEGTEGFIDRGNSHEAAVKAGELGISPRIVHFDPESGVEAIEFLEGYRACTNSDMKQWDVTKSVLSLQKSFHTIDPLPVTKTIFDLIDEHIDQMRAANVEVPRFVGAMLREYENARRAFFASGLDIVPCHNDPMPGNFLVCPGKSMRMVDFEFASNNERAYDLAVTFTEYFYDEPTIIRCVEEIYGHTSPQIMSRVFVAAALADLKWGLWGCINHDLNNTWDFDYHKYGTWKLARARDRMSDRRWGNWIHTL